MHTFKVTITVEHDYQPTFEHILAAKKNYSTPKIYSAKGNLKKRWYVYFSFRNPETGKLERQQNIYGIAHKYKTKEERMSVLLNYRRELLKLLKQGFSPYNDNSHKLALQEAEQLNTLPNSKPNLAIPKKVETSKTKPTGIELRKAFNKALNVRAKTTTSTTKRDYSYKMNVFLKWLKKEHPNIKTIDELTLDIVHDFLDQLYETSSARSRNNYRTQLSSLMQVLEDRGLMQKNLMKNIKPLKSKPQKHERYSNEEIEKIFNHLQKHDPLLLLYIKFISYAFVRPVEACRITIGNIDLEKRTFKYQAKNHPQKTKIIPEILFKELPDLSDKKDDMYLFTPKGIGGYWKAFETNRRDYFSKRFKKIITGHFEFKVEKTLYSLRHTYITRVYRNLEKTHTPEGAISKLMQITGHKTRSALEKYLRDVDAALPLEYSDLLLDD